MSVMHNDACKCECALNCPLVVRQEVWPWPYCFAVIKTRAADFND